ncbi:MAG: T9SS type A sorting domain-containing protein [Bacteroidales bacterium]|nr:T9SS type A sorting domain-containing protein [Bacteroidales bacterium]
MKKLTLLFIALTAFTVSQAQWVNDPVNNTFIANTSADAGDIYLATNTNTGDTYLQWSSFVGGNGWSPTLQRLNFTGEPQWGPDGIHIAGHQFASYSQGFAMTTTTDGGVISCFAADDDHSYAVKINPDGTFPWGEQGVQLFGGLGFSRVEVIATNDGGIWALGFDYNNLYLQYLNNTTGPVITISDNGGQKCVFGQLTLGTDNKVFVTYEKIGNGFYTDKELFVAGYNPDGTQFSPETLLMSSQTFQSTYIHNAISDGMGGGYVYIWHPAIGNFNVYVFHFNQNGASTMTGTIGTPVHSTDYDNLYITAYGTVDPFSHDLLLVYEQTDEQYQANCKVFINRITSNGDKPWGDGIMILDNGTIPCGGYRIDAFEYGDGFSVIYHKGLTQTSTASTVEARGFDMEGNEIWATQMCSSTYSKTGDENSTGFHGGQNIVAWVNSTGAVTGGGPGGLYGQNIGQDGTMGEITPPTPPEPCYPPTNFEGSYSYTDVAFGAMLSWDAPITRPLHYNLYREGLKEVIEIDPEYTSYFDELEPGDYIYKLTAVYDHCESDFALTPSGDNYVHVDVTSIAENTSEAIVTLLKVYNMSGQLVKINNVEELQPGLYILQGLTQDGKLVNQKIIKQSK